MNLEFAAIAIVVLIFSAILHEIAHGLVAEKLGDPTARLLGRITLNPVPHIDPIMSLLLPMILILTGSPIIIGGAKPVPVDPFNLREPKKDMALVSMAGPLTNFLIAFIVALFYNFASPFITDPFILRFIFLVVQLNLLLGIFNLLPIPPLDGSKVVAIFLPDETAEKFLSLGRYGLFIIILIFLSPIPLMQILRNAIISMMQLLGMPIV
jgi:Zn-dependent protease